MSEIRCLPRASVQRLANLPTQFNMRNNFHDGGCEWMCASACMTSCHRAAVELTSAALLVYCVFMVPGQVIPFLRHGRLGCSGTSRHFVRGGQAMRHPPHRAPPSLNSSVSRLVDFGALLASSPKAVNCAQRLHFIPPATPIGTIQNRTDSFNVFQVIARWSEVM